MSKHNPKNERIKRRYFAYLKEAKRNDEQTVDAVAKALSRFESYTKYRDFKSFHIQQAINFKKHLTSQVHSVAPQALLPLARRPTWVPFRTPIFRRRIFQFVGEGNAHCGRSTH